MMWLPGHPARFRIRRATLAVAACATAIVAASALCFAQDDGYDFEPIRYASTAANDPFAELARSIDAGRVTLDYDEKLGYLPALLKAVGIDTDSQMLVFSKTSFQLKLITPRTPRAIYFNDRAYVGYVPGGEVLELTGVDPQLGGVFYSLQQTRSPDGRPVLRRRLAECLQCHSSAMTQSVPGHMVRSVHTDDEGYPKLSSRSFVTTHRSPIGERWGGWYVTGTHGRTPHMGNVTIPRAADAEAFDYAAAGGSNVTDLAGRIDASLYPAAGSDIVALLVLEHQTQMQNLIARAAYQTRIALDQQAETNRMANRPADEITDATRRRIERHGEALVRYMLFVDEVYLADPIEGSSGFAERFQSLGPRDTRGRSLRDLDLRKYLFTYPCSYEIYSPSFDALPDIMKDHVYRRLFDILTGRDQSEWRDDYMISTAKRRAIYEILRATKPGLPEYWTADAAP